jgi:hypothetical protein
VNNAITPTDTSRQLLANYRTTSTGAPQLSLISSTESFELTGRRSALPLPPDFRPTRYNSHLRKRSPEFNFKRTESACPTAHDSERVHRLIADRSRPQVCSADYLRNPSKHERVLGRAHGPVGIGEHPRNGQVRPRLRNAVSHIHRGTTVVRSEPLDSTSYRTLGLGCSS